MNSLTNDSRWMAAALALAQRGLGRVCPNPAVGCVIVRDGRVLGRGWTQPGGRPHAETMALAQAGADATGATVYVSLEPCAHHGKTPPCCDALIAAGVARVVAPMVDPDPRVAGQGFGRLQDAGITVDIGIMADEAETANDGFLSRIRRGRPKLTLKLAASLDGRIATERGESRWITGAAARARVHLMRAQSDAILVGAGTARADDPSLDVRLPGLEGIAPARIIVGGSDFSTAPRLLESASTLRTIHIKAKGVAALPNAEVIDLPADDSGLDLDAAMRELGERGFTRILCEGGGGLAASLLRADLVDELVWMSAGLALGASGWPSIAPLTYFDLDDAPRFDLCATETLGGDVMTVWRPQRQSQA